MIEDTPLYNASSPPTGNGEGVPPGEGDPPIGSGKPKPPSDPPLDDEVDLPPSDTGTGASRGIAGDPPLGSGD